MDLKLFRLDPQPCNVLVVWRDSCFGFPPIYHKLLRMFRQCIRSFGPHVVHPKCILWCVQHHTFSTPFLMFLLSTPKTLAASLLLPSDWLNVNVHTMFFAITSLEDHFLVMWSDSPYLKLSINSWLGFILLVSRKYNIITTPKKVMSHNFFHNLILHNNIEAF